MTDQPQYSAEQVAEALRWADAQRAASGTTVDYAESLLIALSAAYRLKEQECRELKEAEAKREDSVPRSRYDAANQDWLGEKANRIAIQKAAAQEIERLERELRLANLPRPCHSGSCAHIKALEAERDKIVADFATYQSAIQMMTVDGPYTLAVQLRGERDLLAEKLGRLAREVSVTLDQWAHEREQGRSGVVYGSRIGLLREALREAIAATEDKP